MCRYRLVQDGLPLLLPHVTKQLLQPTVTELLHLIEDRSLYVPEEARTAPVKSAQTNGMAAETAAATELKSGSADQPENAEPNAPGNTSVICFQQW